jgi:phosphoribosylformylglycinamidine cyclo-ligase
MAHITGGGITGNLPRMPARARRVAARIDPARLGDARRIFRLGRGQPATSANTRCYKTFNCGIGMVVVVAPEVAEEARRFLTEQGETVHTLGRIVPRAPGQPQTVVA